MGRAEILTIPDFPVVLIKVGRATSFGRKLAAIITFRLAQVHVFIAFSNFPPAYGRQAVAKCNGVTEEHYKCHVLLAVKTEVQWSSGKYSDASLRHMSSLFCECE